MMMLLILTSVLGYELKTAVGTSVFIMAFTAFTGAASHLSLIHISVGKDEEKTDAVTIIKKLGKDDAIYGLGDKPCLLYTSRCV